MICQDLSTNLAREESRERGKAAYKNPTSELHSKMAPASSNSKKMNKTNVVSFRCYHSRGIARGCTNLLEAIVGRSQQ